MDDNRPRYDENGIFILYLDNDEALAEYLRAFLERGDLDPSAIDYTDRYATLSQEMDRLYAKVNEGVPKVPIEYLA